MSFEIVISALVALGVGGLLGYYVQYILQHKKDIESDVHKLKRERYGSILIQMLTILEPKQLVKTQKIRPDFKDIADIKDELRTEILNSIIFASDDVIVSMLEFLHEPDQKTYIDAALAMRKDLWGKNIKIKDLTHLRLLLDDLSNYINAFFSDKKS